MDLRLSAVLCVCLSLVHPVWSDDDTNTDTGSHVTLECATSRDHCKWEKIVSGNETVILDSHTTHNSSDVRLVWENGTCRLEIEKASPGSEGTYICREGNNTVLREIKFEDRHLCRVRIIDSKQVDCLCDDHVLYYLVNINGEVTSNNTATTLYMPFKGSLSCTGVSQETNVTSQEMVFLTSGNEGQYELAFWIITVLIVIAVVITILTQAVTSCHKEYRQTHPKSDYKQGSRRSTETSDKILVYKNSQPGSGSYLLDTQTESVEDKV